MAQTKHDVPHVPSSIVINGALSRLGWTSDTAPDGCSTLDAYDTDQRGIVSLEDQQEKTLFYAQPLLDTLRSLPQGLSWDDLWQAMLPHMVES